MKAIVFMGTGPRLLELRDVYTANTEPNEADQGCGDGSDRAELARPGFLSMQSAGALQAPLTLGGSYRAASACCKCRALHRCLSDQAFGYALPMRVIPVMATAIADPGRAARDHRYHPSVYCRLRRQRTFIAALSQQISGSSQDDAPVNGMATASVRGSLDHHDGGPPSGHLGTRSPALIEAQGIQLSFVRSVVPDDARSEGSSQHNWPLGLSPVDTSPGTH